MDCNSLSNSRAKLIILIILWSRIIFLLNLFRKYTRLFKIISIGLDQREMYENILFIIMPAIAHTLKLSIYSLMVFLWQIATRYPIVVGNFLHTRCMRTHPLEFSYFKFNNENYCNFSYSCDQDIFPIYCLNHCNQCWTTPSIQTIASAIFLSFLV